MLGRTDHERLGADHGGGARGPVKRVLMLAQLLTLDVELGQQATKPAGHPPCGISGEGHQGRDQGHAHQEGVERDAYRETESYGFDGAAALGNEGEEDEEHDEGGRGHYPRAVGEAGTHRVPCVTGLHELFAHTGHQKDLVVHG